MEQPQPIEERAVEQGPTQEPKLVSSAPGAEVSASASDQNAPNAPSVPAGGPNSPSAPAGQESPETSDTPPAETSATGAEAPARAASDSAATPAATPPAASAPTAPQSAEQPAAPSAEQSTPASADQAGAGSADTRISGKVVAIREDVVAVDYGGKTEGVIPLGEFPADQAPRVGEEFAFIPQGFDRDSGQMRLALRASGEADVTLELKVGDVIEAKVTGMNTGGLEFSVGGLRGFMPKSQVDLQRHDDFRPFLNRRIECVVTEIDRKGKSVLLSRRKILEKRQDEERARIKQTLEVGQVCQGTVRRLADFGAFIDIGGVEGLLHISDMSHGRVGHPKEVLKVNDQLSVKILKLDTKRDRISLGLKQLKPDPWTTITERFQAGQTIEGKVTRLMDFGAFAEVENGVEGLIPVSEMSWTKRVNHPKDVVSPGETVKLQVLQIDAGKRRMSLSLRALMEDPWQSVADKFAPDSVVKGTVTRAESFGAFVKLEEGIEGLVHISELRHERVRSVTDVVNPGDEVEVRVLGLDLTNRKISLSIKQASEAPAPEMPVDSGKPRRRKERPRKGGLDW